MITKVFCICNGLKKVQHCSFLFWNIFANPHRQPRTVADDILNIHFSGKGKKIPALDGNVSANYIANSFTRKHFLPGQE